MALKDNWIDLKDAIDGTSGSGDDITVKPINDIAHAVIDNEINKADKTLSNIDNETFKQKAEQAGVGGSVDTYTKKEIDDKLKNYPEKDEVIQPPTTANVGQTIVVKEIDENGKPTKWEAVDVGGTQRVEIRDNVVTIEPNKFYVFPEMDNLNITLGGELNPKVVQEYKFRFSSGAIATTLTLPEMVKGDIKIEANNVIEISIIDNYAVSQSWAVS